MLSSFLYHDICLFSMDGQEKSVKEAIRDAISKSGRDDLELSGISGYSCPSYYVRHHNGSTNTNCSATAVFANGVTAPVTVNKKELLKEYERRSRGKVIEACKIDFTVTVHRLGPDFQGESSISRFY